MKRAIPVLLAVCAAFALAGCQSAPGSYSAAQQDLAVLAQRVAELEDRSQELTGQVEELKETVERQQQQLEDQQRALSQQREFLRGYEKVREWIDETKEQAAGAASAIREELTAWLQAIEYDVDRGRVTGLGALPQQGLLLAVSLGDEGRLYVTYDPVTLSDGSPEDEDYIRNESLSDTRTLPVAESTFYGIEESRAVPITQAELMAKAAPRDNPRLFDFYVLDGEVYMIAERYLP